MSFDPSDSAATYNDRSFRGGMTNALGYHWQSSSGWTGSNHDGKAKTLQHIQGQLDHTALADYAEAWGRVRDHAQTVHTKLQQAYTDAFSEWEGDDADRAAKTFGFAVLSVKSVHDVAHGMQQGTSTLASMAASVKGLNSSAPSGWGAFGNAILDDTTGGAIAKGTGLADDTDGGGANLDPAVQSMQTAIAKATSQMPNTMTWQVKTGAKPSEYTNNNIPPSPKAVGGLSSSGANGGAGHEVAPVSGIGKVKSLGTGTSKGGGDEDPPPIDRPDPWIPPTDGSGSGGGSGTDAPFTSGAGAPGLDDGSSLAGYDPSGLGGAGGGGLGGGGLGSGAGGLGSGAGGLGSGAGGLAGAGLGAGGGAVGGPAGAAAGGGGRPGALGAAPMRGGAPGGGDEDERERSTWLNEDDDVWGGTEAPPSVIT